jgi:FeS assembly SUF system protein
VSEPASHQNIHPPSRVALPQAPAETHAEKVMREKIGDVSELAAGGGRPSPIPDDLPADQQALAARIVAKLRGIYDPEIPLNIYDLGLIYKLEIDPSNAVTVRMTLTAPGCPVADMILRMVKQDVESLEDVPRCAVDLVWDPPWSKEMLSEEAKLELGLF